MKLDEIAIKFEPVGSRVTCDPPPTDTDQDILVLVADMFDAAFAGWSCETEAEYEGDGSDLKFVSYREGNVNLIVTDDEKFFDTFMIATRTAKKLNLMQKKDRVTLFRAILYGAV